MTRFPETLTQIKNTFLYNFQLFHDGGPYHIETRPLIAKQNWFLDDRDLRHERAKTEFVVFVISPNFKTFTTSCFRETERLRIYHY